MVWYLYICAEINKIMKKGIRLLISMSLLLLFMQCKEDTIEQQKTSLFVTVLSDHKLFTPTMLVESATVKLMPGDKTGKTDRLGTLYFNDLEPGNYELEVTHHHLGKHSRKVELKPDIHSEQTFYFKSEGESAGKVFEMLMPEKDSVYSSKEEMHFRFRFFSDDNTPMHVSLKSNLDGVLFEDSLSVVKGILTFPSLTLSAGVHDIQLEIRKANGIYITQNNRVDMTKVNPVRFTSIEAFKDVVELKWERYDGADFRNYEIRSNQKVIATIDNPDQTSFFDPIFIYGARYFYDITINTIYDRSETFRADTAVSCPDKRYSVPGEPKCMHPSKPYFYFEESRETGKIMLWNYQTNEQKMLPVTLPNAKMLIGNNRTNDLFVCRTYHKDSDKIVYQVNSVTMEVIKALKVSDKSFDIYSISTLADNLLLVSLQSETSQSKDILRVFSLDTYQQVGEDIICPAFQMIQDHTRNRVTGIVASRWVTKYDEMVSATFSRSGMLLGKTIRKFDGYLEDPVFSPDGTYMLVNVNPVYKLCYADDNFGYIGSLNMAQGGSDYYNQDGAIFSADSKQMYIFNSSARSVSVYTCPDRYQHKIIRTKGEPVRQFMQNDKLIVVSKIPDYLTVRYTMEMFDLNER